MELENKYIIDSCSLIDLKIKYPADVFPGIWDKIDDLIVSNRLIAPEEVFNEIENGDDELVPWAKKRKDIFVSPDRKQIELLKEILEKYPFLGHYEKEGPNADPWIIALARAKNEFPTLIPAQYVVVTEESQLRRSRIPFVCNEYQIKCINVIQLFKEEGWKFY